MRPEFEERNGGGQKYKEDDNPNHDLLSIRREGVSAYFLKHKERKLMASRHSSNTASKVLMIDTGMGQILINR